MSERGVFAVDRGWFEHPMFAAEPFTEREAWAWLISEAAWKFRTRRVGSFVVQLRRGQVSASIRFLEQKWQWKAGRVERFLKRLKTATMIATDTRHGLTVITVCNYDKYQRVSLPDATDTATPNATAPRQERDNTEDIKDIKQEREGGDGVLQSGLGDEAHAIAVSFLEAGKLDRQDPQIFSLQYQVQSWLNEKIPADFIRARGCALVAGKARFPHVNYIAKAIRSGWEDELSRPKLTVIEGKPYEATRAAPNGILAAQDRLLDRLRSFDEPIPDNARTGSGEGATVVRMLPERGR